VKIALSGVASSCFERVAQTHRHTRFPRDSAARYAREADFAEWGGRLEIFGLDSRHTPSVEAFLPSISSPPASARDFTH
jgi:hypothetical protein